MLHKNLFRLKILPCLARALLWSTMMREMLQLSQLMEDCCAMSHTMIIYRLVI